MPKIAVDKNRKPMSRDNDVGLSWKATVVPAEPQFQPSNNRSDGVLDVSFCRADP